MYRIALCDDDLEFSNNFIKQVNIFFADYSIAYEILSFPSLDALEEANQKEPFDLFFLDIFLKKECGMDYAKKLYKAGCRANIIFITSSPDYAVDSFEVAPLYYLVKPLQEQKLKAALLRALSAGSHMLTLYSSQNTFLIPSDDILYMEVFNHSILIHRTNKTTEEIHGSLNNIEQRLPPLLFSRIHRSYLVNIRYIESIQRYHVLLSDNTRLPVSRNRFTQIQALLLNDLYEKSLYFNSLLH